MIYRLAPGPDATEFFRGQPDNIGEAPVCPECGEPVGMLPWLPPYRAELSVLGRTFAPVVFGGAGDLLLTEQLAREWREEALVGLEGFSPVEIIAVTAYDGGSPSGPPPKYVHVRVVHSKFAAIDLEQSGVSWGERPTCEVCRVGRDLRGCREIVLETLPRENIFIARGLVLTLVDDAGHAFFSERAGSAVKLIPGPAAGFWFLGGEPTG